ncbi:MAG: CoA transferase [Actinobacteria bacterium]|nr:CoA transferase [Actinomycetota bacterium]
MAAVRLGDVGNADAARFGKPLDDVRILAAEQMQALPFGTQLLTRFGAEVVKIEHPTTGESGRTSLPAITDPEGRKVGATYLRNNLNKRSVGIDLKTPRGRELFLELVPHFDVVAENFKSGTMERLGLGYDDVARVHPSVVYLSISGFGSGESPYRGWPAYASIAEAMSGLYEYQREPDHPPAVGSAGALGDTSAAIFGVIGVLAALRHRDRTGEGQYVDVAMLDSMVVMADIVPNFWSLGLERGGTSPTIFDGFKASDGWFVIQVSREHQFERLAKIIGHPEWVDDPRFAERAKWRDHIEDVFRPAIEEWASTLTKREACATLATAGIAAGPSNGAEDVVTDPHVAAHNMLVEVPRPDGVEQPVLVSGNPVKMSKLAEGPETRPPWTGEHTEEVLRAELGLSDNQLADLRAKGVIA